MLAGMVALAACLLAFGPAPSAMALAANGVAAQSHPAESAKTAPQRSPMVSKDVGTKSHAFEPYPDEAVTDAPSLVAAGAGRGDTDTDRPSDPESGDRDPDDDQDQPGKDRAGAPGRQPPATTPTTLPVPIPTQPPTTTAPTPAASVTSVPPTTVTTIKPSTTTTSPRPATSDDERSSDGGASKTPGSVSKPPADAPVGAGPSDPPPPEPVAPAVGGAADSPSAGERSRAVADWSFLTGEDFSVVADVEPIETPGAESRPSTVVLSWLVERETMSPTMAVLSPVVVLLTIWDAAASAGSGLAAPASGLGTLVLLVLFEKGSLANGARLLRRRGEA